MYKKHLVPTLEFFVFNSMLSFRWGHRERWTYWAALSLYQIPQSLTDSDLLTDSCQCHREKERERSDTHTPHGDKLSKAEVMKELSTDWKFDKCVFMPMWCVCVCVCREYTHTHTAWGIESTLPNDTTAEAAVYFSVCGSFLWTLIHQLLVSYIFNYTHVWHMSLDPWRINMNWISN